MVSRVSEDLSAVPAQAAHDLGDFARFLEQLSDEGFEYAVIGGCAVVAYASLIGEELFSADLDISRRNDLTSVSPQPLDVVMVEPRIRT